jgi:uncharacterized membrane protein
MHEGARMRPRDAPLVGFLKATLAGGLLFLLPLVLVAVLTGHAIAFAKKVVPPLAKALHVEGALGPAEETIFAVLLLLVIAISAGLVARTRGGKAVIGWSERTLLGSLPQYQVVKGMTAGLARLEDDAGLTPVLVDIEDAWQLGYLLEPVGNGWVAVFLPQAPTPMSGNVMYLPATRVRRLDMTMMQAMTIVRSMGIGSSAALRTADLTREPGQ